MKIVFVDDVGVLICLGHQHNLKPEIVDNFNYILRSTMASVVVIGDCRTIKTIDEIKEFFASQGILASSIIGTTPDYRHGYNYRHREIASWIETHKDEIESFVILDDHDCNYRFREQLVRTDFEVGLTREDAEKAIAILETAQ